jgi:hypothetical protein
MNGKPPMISTTPPFVPSINSGRALRLSKDERRVFQQNLYASLTLTFLKDKVKLEDTGFFVLGEENVYRPENMPP